MSTFTVQFANQLEGADQYGNVTYSVKFMSEADSVLMRVSPKTAVQPGAQFNGVIEEKMSKNGKPYRMFKREAPQQAPNGVASQGFPTKEYIGKKDNSDGMRQGMSINNAAAYVIHLSDKGAEVLSPEEWAKQVVEYARQLYIKSEDLNKKVEDAVLEDISDEPIDLSEIPFN